MILFTFQCSIAVIILSDAVNVQALPVQTMETCLTAVANSPVVMSNKTYMQLTSRHKNSTGLLPLWEEASDLAEEIKTQVAIMNMVCTNAYNVHVMRIVSTLGTKSVWKPNVQR